MDNNGEIIDFLGGRNDIDNGIVKTVGKAKVRFDEDSLRILRAVRFATILGFKLDDDTKEAIIECRHLLRNLSYYRKKEELDKIFSSSRANDGIKLLLDLGLDKYLDLDNLDQITSTSNLIGIWSILNVVDKYPFNSSEKALIKEINKVMGLVNTDPFVLYKYGLYVNSVAAEIKGLDKKKVTRAYNSLLIQSRKDLDISSNDIMSLLNKGPGSYIKNIYDDIEREVLYKRLNNNNSDICKYIIDRYNG
jgi:tRNA nucleotidyltransferase (CCA-adding enzyme)